MGYVLYTMVSIYICYGLLIFSSGVYKPVLSTYVHRAWEGVVRSRPHKDIQPTTNVARGMFELSGRRYSIWCRFILSQFLCSMYRYRRNNVFISTVVIHTITSSSLWNYPILLLLLLLLLLFSSSDVNSFILGAYYYVNWYLMPVTVFAWVHS